MSSYANLLGSAGINWGGADEISQDDINLFDELRGVHHPNGPAQPRALVDGKRYFSKDGTTEFAVTRDTGEADWGDYQPGAGFRSVGTAAGSDDGGRGLRIWQRKSTPAAAPAPAPKPQEPAYEPDKAKMAEAFTRAQIAKDQYAASIPTYDTGKDPYTAASEYGRKMQDSLLRFQDFADAKSGAQTTEISEAGKSALSRFGGAVADYKDPATYWQKYLNA